MSEPQDSGVPTSVPGTLVEEGEDRTFKPLRQHVGDGEINGHSFDISMCLSSGTILVEFDQYTVEYDTTHMVKTAHEIAHGSEPSDE